MKKFFILVGISIILQFIYYILFMKDLDFYNIVGIISILFFSVLFFVRTYHYCRYNIIWNILIVFMVVITLMSLNIFIDVWGSFYTGVAYIFVYNIRQPQYSDPTFIKLWEYNLVTLNFIVFFLNFVYLVYKARSDDLERRLIFLYRMTTVLIILLVVYLTVTNFHFVYFSIFLFLSLLIFWFALPVLYNVCTQFQNFYGIYIGWCLSAMLVWPLLNQIIPQLKSVNGFLFNS